MSGDTSLETVRKDIDAIDEAIHDLIMRRTQLVEQVRRIKHDWPVKIQPSREAEIVLRLLARHRGPFPKRELVAIWRQLITATLQFEGPFCMAVYTPADDSGDAGTWDVARDHFGMFTPVLRFGSVRSVIEAVRRQEATVGVLPLPSQDDADPWWRHLITSHADAPKIIARLPFAGASNARNGAREALAIAPIPVLATGRDRVLVGGDSEHDLPLGQLTAALKQSGLSPVLAWSWWESEPPHASLYCVELDGFVDAGDPRLQAVRARLGKALNRLVWLGGYAVPLSAEDLGPGWPMPVPVRQPRAESAAGE